MTDNPAQPARPAKSEPVRPATIAITMREEDDESVSEACRDLWDDATFRNGTERMASFERGEWSFVGIRAHADILIPYGADYITATLDSPGLWGVESDSSDEYKNEIYEEERATLTAMLESISQAISQPVSQPEKPTPGYPSPLLDVLLDPCMIPALEAYAASKNANAVRCLENARAAIDAALNLDDKDGDA